MSADRFVSPDDIRSLFAQAMSTMYRTEVPLYGTLVDLVAEINDAVLTAHPALADSWTAPMNAPGSTRNATARSGSVLPGNWRRWAACSR